MEASQKTSRTANALTVTLFFAAGLPFLLSLVFHTVGPIPQRAAKAADRPALVFDQYMVNLREVLPKPVVHARFSFRNAGRNTVAITDLKPSCGCLNPRLDKRVFEPNESGQFLLRVQTPNEEPGLKEYTVKVLYEDPAPREVELTFKCVLPERTVVVRPQALIFYQLGSGSTTKAIVVTDYRKRPLLVTGVETASELVSAKVNAVDRDLQGHRRIRIGVTVGENIPPGKHRALISIATDDHEYPQLRVPLLIQGPRSGLPRIADKLRDADAPRRRQ